MGLFKNKKGLIKVLLPICIVLVIILSAFISVSAESKIVEIEDAILNNTNNNIVLIDKEANTQTGFKTLNDVMTTIGNGDHNYTIVFVRDYNMIPTTDQNSMIDNGKAAKSLTITSKYVSSNDTSQEKNCTVTAGNGNCCWIFNADTVIRDFNLKATAAINMFGYGHNFTIDENVTTSENVSVYGGGDSKYTTSDMSFEKTNLTVNSGKFNIVCGGNIRSSAKLDVVASIGGSTSTRFFFAGAQEAGMTQGSSVVAKVDGTDGAKILDSFMDTKVANGMANGDTVDFTIKNLTEPDNARPTIIKSSSTTKTPIVNLNVDGNCHGYEVSLSNMKIENNGTLTLGYNNGYGNLKLQGNLTLGDKATYIHSGSGTTQSVGGDLIVGAGAKVQFYKETATSNPIPMVINGKYDNTGNKLGVEYYDRIAGADGDVLFSFASESNADINNYKTFKDGSSQALYEYAKDGKNIKLAKVYDCPSYYHPVENVPNLYYYEEVGTNSISDSVNRKIYRFYDTTNNKWYSCDSNGNKTSETPLTADQILKEHPQPSKDYTVDYKLARATMIKLENIGRFKINGVAATNATGLAYGKYGTGSGIPSTFVNADNQGKSNASWAVIKKTNSTSSVYKAYLVMTTTLSRTSSDVEKLKLLNQPMTLKAPSGNTMKSNGYLPENFTVAIAGTGAENLTYNTPTILTDYWNQGSNNNLGEAMTITDVTDFVKAEGYGKYYGIDIPASGIDPDTAIGWRLVIIEEDTSMNYMRKTALQMGPMSNSNSIEPTEMKVSFGGFTTPESGDFGGQVLIVGSDDTGSSQIGGVTNSNIQMTFYPDFNDKSTAILIGENDPDTEGIDRPTGSWSQGLIDYNGKRVDNNQVSNITHDGAMGIDFSLMDLTNKKNENWETSGGSNIYLTHKSEAVGIESSFIRTGYIGYIDTIGLSTDIAAPTFETQITHDNGNSITSSDADIVAGDTVIIKASAENNTIKGSVKGSFSTKVVVTVDDRLSNIRGMDDSNSIIGVFHDYDEATGKTVDREVVGIYNETDHTITFDFGSGNNNYPGYSNYNSQKDKIDIIFKADTNDEATKGVANMSYNTKIDVAGNFILRDEEVVNIGPTIYDYDTDKFDTKKNRVIVSKTVAGEGSDKTKKFDFVAILKDANGRLLSEGTKISYEGDVISGSGAIVPASGTLTVDSKGSVKFKLSNGQKLVFDNFDAQSINISEVGNSEYTCTWDKNNEDTQSLKDGFTGEISGINKSTTAINFHNELKKTVSNKGNLTFTKIVTGKNIDSSKAFDFTATIRDENGNLIKEGTKLSYTGDVINGTGASPIKSGTVVVNSKGQINFSLKHGQTVTFKDLPECTVKATEKVEKGYGITWSKDNANSNVVAKNGSTTEIKVPINKTTSINYYNNIILYTPVVEPDPNKDNKPTTSDDAILEVTKYPDKVATTAGDRITYTFSVKNVGTKTSESVYIEDDVPDNTKFVKINDNIGKYGVDDGQEYATWLIPSLKKGESVTLSFTVKVNEDVENGTSIFNVGYYKIVQSSDEAENIDIKKTGQKTNSTEVKVYNKVSQADSVNTGDSNLLVLYIGLLFVAFVTLTVFYRKKSRI